MDIGRRGLGAMKTNRNKGVVSQEQNGLEKYWLSEPRGARGKSGETE
jgi:hypothetical protein